MTGLAFGYGGQDRVVGVTAKVETFENEFLWGPWESLYRSGQAIDGSSTDAGNTGATNILRQGLLMGMVTASKKLKPWDPSATTGEEYIWGILGRTLNLHNIQGTDTDRLTGVIYVAGGALSDKLIVPGTTALGLSSSSANEHLARKMLRQNWTLNDDYDKSRPEYIIHAVSAAERTAGITFAFTNSHRHYYNSGGTLAFALGALTPVKGIEFKVTAVHARTDRDWETA